MRRRIVLNVGRLMATTARSHDTHERTRLRGFVRSLRKAARCWCHLDPVYMADLEREARIYLVQLAGVGGPVVTEVPPPTSITFYPKRSKKGSQ
jgi:hypothetical protein